jgi:two-component system response regulator RegA
MRQIVAVTEAPKMATRKATSPLLPELLLVDESERTSGSLAAAMKNFGYAVTICRSAQEALHATEKFPPDYVVTELRLPDNSGLSLISLIKQSRPQTTVVVLTAHASIASAVEAIKRGASDYLVKPAKASRLMAALSRMTHEEQTSLSYQTLSVRQLEWEHINSVLLEYGGNISAAARALSMHRKTLQRKLSKRGSFNQ